MVSVHPSWSKKESISIAIPTARGNWNDEFGDDDAYEDDERGRRESERFSGIAGQKQMQDRLGTRNRKIAAEMRTITRQREERRTVGRIEEGVTGSRTNTSTEWRIGKRRKQRME